MFYSHLFYALFISFEQTTYILLSLYTSVLPFCSCKAFKFRYLYKYHLLLLETYLKIARSQLFFFFLFYAVFGSPSQCFTCSCCASGQMGQDVRLWDAGRGFNISARGSYRGLCSCSLPQG